MNGLLSPTEFQYDDESRGTAATRWTVWIRDFEVFMIAAGINKGAQKKATLLHVVGKAARDIYYSKAEDDDTYNDVKDTLVDHFTPLRNVDFEIYKFSQLKQREQKTFDDFMVRLRETAARCDFTDTPAQLKRQIITGCKSLKLKEHILNTAAITIDQITQRARTEEVVINQAKLIQTQNNTQVKPHIIAAIDDRQTTRGNRHDRPNFKNDRPKGRCFSCGYDYPHKGECPAKGRKCNVCKEIGHFSVSKFCKKRIHIVEERQDEDENEDHKDNNRQYLFTIDERGKERPMCKLKMNDSVISILIDSGSGSNVIDETTLRMLKVRPKLKTAKTKIYAFDSKRAIP